MYNVHLDNIPSLGKTSNRKKLVFPMMVVMVLLMVILMIVKIKMTKKKVEML